MHVQQNADTEWIDDPRSYDGDKQDAGLDLRTQQLRERHALLVKQQADISERLHTGGQVWGEHTDSYRTLLEERLRIFYMQYLPTGSAFPDTKRAVSHFGGNAAAINEALKKKYGVDLNDAPSLHSPPPNREHVPAANDHKCDSPHRKPATICQCLADFVDAPASPFAAIGVKSKDFSLKKLHCGRGGACEAMGDVGQTLCEIPRAAADGLVDGLKNTCESASDGPKMAVDGVSKAFRHDPPHSKK